jgi:hypothetical protein
MRKIAMEVKDFISLGVAGVALVISATNAWYEHFRDRTSATLIFAQMRGVGAPDMPLYSFDRDGLSAVAFEPRLVIQNRGNQPIAITDISLRLVNAAGRPMANCQGLSGVDHIFSPSTPAAPDSADGRRIDAFSPVPLPAGQVVVLPISFDHWAKRDGLPGVRAEKVGEPSTGQSYVDFPANPADPKNLAKFYTCLDVEIAVTHRGLQRKSILVSTTHVEPHGAVDRSAQTGNDGGLERPVSLVDF